MCVQNLNFKYSGKLEQTKSFDLNLGLLSKISITKLEGFLQQFDNKRGNFDFEFFHLNRGIFRSGDSEISNFGNSRLLKPPCLTPSFRFTWRSSTKSFDSIQIESIRIDTNRYRQIGLLQSMTPIRWWIVFSEQYSMNSIQWIGK